jgi:uncharacterized protein
MDPKRVVRWLRQHSQGLKVFAAVSSGVAALTSGAAVMLCERTVRLKRRALRQHHRRKAVALAGNAALGLVEAEVTAGDGVTLRGWYFPALQERGRAVLALHGQADNRSGMLAHAKVFLARGYSVLCPDLRAHGESGGKVASYGCREAQDVALWIEWLKGRGQADVVAFGESMGAAVLLESLRLQPELRAVAVDSPFANMREIAYDLVGQSTRTGPWAGRTVLRPVIETGFMYGRLRYGVGLGRIAPETAIAECGVPILLIHPTDDKVIPWRHAERLSEHGQEPFEVWEVPAAGHCRALARWPEEFERRVCGWFERHLTACGRRGRMGHRVPNSE